MQSTDSDGSLNLSTESDQRKRPSAARRKEISLTRKATKKKKKPEAP